MVSQVVMTLYLGAASVADIQKQRLSMMLLALSVVPIAVSIVMNKDISLESRMWGVIFGGAAVALTLLTKGGIGVGDGLMFLILGAVCGGTECVAIMGASLLFSGLYSGIMLILKRLGPKSRIPFIPFIFAAYSVVSLLPVLIR